MAVFISIISRLLAVAVSVLKLGHITYLGIVTCFSDNLLRSDDSGRGREVENCLNATFVAAYPPLPQLFYSI